MKIVLTKERYEELLKAELKLNALDYAGVDNWEGYEIAMSELRKEEDEGD